MWWASFFSCMEAANQVFPVSLRRPGPRLPSQPGFSLARISLFQLCTKKNLPPDRKSAGESVIGAGAIEWQDGIGELRCGVRLLVGGERPGAGIDVLSERYSECASLSSPMLFYSHPDKQ